MRRIRHLRDSRQKSESPEPLKTARHNRVHLSLAREHTGQVILQEIGMPHEQEVALNHHGRVTGDGYPRQFIDSEIPLLARMAAICDVYDALTSEQPYGRPCHPVLALRHMATWLGQFDRRLFDAFVLAVGVYPVGSLVRLASRRLAIVVAPGNRPLTPRFGCS